MKASSEQTSKREIAEPVEEIKFSFDIEMNSSQFLKSLSLVNNSVEPVEETKNNYYLGAFLFIM